MARTKVVVLLLVVSVAAIYGRVAGHDFVDYDDPTYLLDNEIVREGLTPAGVRWAFTTGHAANWHPLTWLSHMLDVQVFGMWPGGHHLVNVVLHGLNAVLLLAALRALGGGFWRSTIVAFLFAVHPLRVESVAWVAERKDLLAGTFFGLSLLAYAGYARRPGPGRHALVGLCIVLGMMAKPVLMTLPCLLLLLDLWPLRRWSLLSVEARSELPGAPRRLHVLVLEKVPWFLLVVASGVVTVLVQRGGAAVHPLWSLSVGERLANACLGYAAYLEKTVWPVDLAVFYPHPAIVSPEAFPDLLPRAIAAGTLLLAAGGAALWLLRRRPYLFVGWSWYVGMLVPMIGLVQVGNQALADRYAYLPTIGVYCALVWGAADLARSARARTALAAAAALAVVVLGVLSFRQAGRWKDTETLFTHALAATEDNYVAHLQLGVLAKERGHLDEAVRRFRGALEVNDNIAEAHNNLGVVLLLQERPAAAGPHFERAIFIKPGYAEAHYNAGLVLAGLGEAARAEQRLREALRLDPEFAEAHNNLGVLLRRRGELDEARHHFEQAVRIAPGYEDALRNLRSRTRTP